MRTVRLLVGFQGTHYEGWQSQKKGKTVQEVFERILTKIFKEKTTVFGSSRTDSGVHAKGLVAHFRTRSGLPDPKLKAALNFYLPHDIVVFSAKTVPSGFHARYSAKSKLYQYDIWTGSTPPLFESPYVWRCPFRLNVTVMKKASKYFVGRHDFSAFKDGDVERSTHVRTILRLAIKKEGPIVRILIEADGFLTHMVRIIVGTLVEAGRGRITPEAIPEILHSKDRRKAGPTAKAMGLMLLKVKY